MRENKRDRARIMSSILDRLEKAYEKYFRAGAYDLCCACKWCGTCHWSIIYPVGYKSECDLYSPLRVKVIEL